MRSFYSFPLPHSQLCTCPVPGLPPALNGPGTQYHYFFKKNCTSFVIMKKRLEEVKILIRGYYFYSYVKRDRLEFRVNVKEFGVLLVTREKAKYL